jgi:hypothetical protein
MNDICVYHIQLRGQVDEDEINAMSPLYMVREWVDTAVTQFTIRTDQSGLIGLMRHLHRLGFVFLSFNCEQ